ncbi:unnamed protein product [Coregonus sp. 'balchen']|nr:unnamed protein product [Coregonus sp. 'balchen']
MGSPPLFLLLLGLTPMLLLTVHTLHTSAPPLAPPPSCGPGQSWAVRLHTDSELLEAEGTSLHELASRVAEQAGLENRGQIGQLEGHYLFCAGSEEEGRPGDVLAAHPHVLWHSQEHVLSRSKRAMAFNDPRYPLQWHLHNDVRPGMDINVTGVWERNITGTGVTVVVVDDGVQHTLQDIQRNYSPEGSYDLNSNDPDPMPHPDARSDNHHGTRCAGEIAAVSNNSFCAVSESWMGRSQTVWRQWLSTSTTRSTIWGPDDDGRTVDGPHPLGKAALQHGVIAGRRGFGSIFVVASGNGGQYKDNCNYDGYANSIYTVTIGAVNEEGKMPFYAEECASMLAVTSDWSLQQGTGCTDGHTGTSAAAPLAAGMVALMLQVRPCLTWRDVQHIITYTATQYDVQGDWKINGAGFHHSHQHGFGLLNAWRLVNAAKVWEMVPFLVSYQSPVLKEEELIPAYPEQLNLTWNVTAADLRQSGMQTLEHVSVTLTLAHSRRGNVEIVLLCPSGMDTSGYSDWTFSTVRCWGERAEGQYRLQVSDHKEPALPLGSLKHWKLTLYGSSLSFEEVKERQSVVEEAMGGQYLDSSFSLPCHAGMDIPPEIVSPFTSNSLKSLLLLGCFALFWSLYYTLEGRGARGSRGGLGRGSGTLGDSSELEMQSVLDLEDKVPFITRDAAT